LTELDSGSGRQKQMALPLIGLCPNRSTKIPHKRNHAEIERARPVAPAKTDALIAKEGAPARPAPTRGSISV
jgi:hypothetical protein